MKLVFIKLYFSLLELPDESEQFRFLREPRLSNLKDSVGLLSRRVSDEVLNKHDFILSIQQSNSKIGKTKKLLTRKMGNPTGAEIGVSAS